MNIRRTTKARRGTAVLALAVALAFGIAACGGGDDSPEDSGASEQSEDDGNDGGKSDNEQPDTSKVIATSEGPQGLTLEINSVRRESGGFVTVNGQIKNSTDKAYYDISAWRGTEQELTKSGLSVGGATLVDDQGKKRYYVLRDTEGRCLCTAGFDKVEANRALTVFMQFPAPPDDVIEVDFSLPTFQTAALEIEE
jgi:hypothetical protein